MSSPTTALAQNTTPNPTRRSSWKSKNDIYTSMTPSFSEKHSTTTTTINPTTPTATNPFTDTPSSSSSSTPDIEAQDPHTFTPNAKSRHRNKYRVCRIVMCYVVVWAALVVGALWVLDWVWPGGMPYQRLREEISGLEGVVEGLKAQVGGLVGNLRGGNVNATTGGELGVDGNGTVS